MTERRYRRSPLLLLEWQGPTLVLVECTTARRFRVDDRLISLLSRLERWTAVDGLAGHGVGTAVTELERLVALGVVEEMDGETIDPSPRHHWNPFDLAVHRRSNTGGYREERVTAGGTPPPPLVKRRPAGSVTALPPPAAVPQRFDALLDGRRSVRTYAAGALRLQDLSTLLHRSARVVRVYHDPQVGDQALRPYAAGGARSELEIYVVATDVEGLAPGPHYYDPHAHELVHVRERDAHQERLLRSVHAATGDSLNRDPAAVLLITAVFARVMWKYEGIGLGLIYKDTGSLLQTLYLVATGLGLAPCAVGGGEELANSRWLGLDPMEEAQVGCFLVGPCSVEQQEPTPPPAPEGELATGGTSVPERRPPGVAEAAAPAGAASPVVSSERILRMSQAFIVTAALRSGLELGVFDRLAGGPARVEDIATSIHADLRGTRILLDGLVAVGLASMTDGAYALDPLTASLLGRGGTGYLGTTLSAYVNGALWEALGRLPDAVRRGGTALGVEVDGSDSPYWAEMALALDTTLDEPASFLANLLVPQLRSDTPTVLDAGCGSGAYGLAVASRLPTARVTLVDRPGVLTVARRRAERLELADRVELVEGDLLGVPLGGPFDAAIVSHVLHHLGREDCLRLLERLAGALCPGGQLVIQEFVAGIAGPRTDPAPYLFSLVMLGSTADGEAHSLPFYEEMLAAAGFSSCTLHTATGLPTRFLVAERRVER